MAEELNLTADQKTKVEAALKAQREAIQGIKDATPEERRAKMQEGREGDGRKMKEILTAEQYTKWEKLRYRIVPVDPGSPWGKTRRPRR